MADDAVDTNRPSTSDGVPLLPIFYSAYSKAHWATHHIETLAAQLQAYVKHGIRVHVEQPDGPDGEQVVHVEADNFVKMAVSLSIGDVVRSLRDALDHFMSAACRELLGTGSEERIVFPIGEDAENLLGVMETRFVSTRLDHISDVVVYDIKPTKAGNFPLWAMNKINNSDKHREVVTVAKISLDATCGFRHYGRLRVLWKYRAS